MASPLPPRQAWQRLARIQQIVAQQPAVAWAVHCMPLYDQLELTLELLRADGDPEHQAAEPLPSNVIRFRPRHAR